METIEEKFYRLKKLWKDETGYYSSILPKVENKYYKEIIKMGYDVVSLMINDLIKEPQHWFYALHEITGENPIKKEHRGNMKLMSKDWIEWAKQKGIV